MALSIQSYGANFHFLSHNYADFIHQISGTQIAFPHKTRFMKKIPNLNLDQFNSYSIHFVSGDCILVKTAQSPVFNESIYQGGYKWPAVNGKIFSGTS